MFTSFLLRCHDTIWSSLHIIILNIPPSRLPIFPALAGSIWFLTLATLLLTWLGRGMPRYPGQSNPHVAFISDIASFELKPLFLIGASMTAVGFWFTVAVAHVMRYEPGFALLRCPEHFSAGGHPVPRDQTTRSGNQQQPTGVVTGSCTADKNDTADEPDKDDEESPSTIAALKLVSLFSIFSAGMASTALILLGVMDTFRYHFAHAVLLRVCFGGLALQAAGTAIVYSNEVLGFVAFLTHGGVWQRRWRRRRRVRVRVFASLSTALILVELFLGIAFIALTVPEDVSDYRAAGILEWVIAFLGTVYLWLFVGFFDRVSFEGYVPSVIYTAAAKGQGQLSVSTSQEGSQAVTDAERAPLLAQGSSSQYT
ncbi:uncharacterized protein BO97DRAFT_406732 [Aspergillus homomorphus CBS 101889]|uniref:CWH43-like N-terminal domain-containing protein n=1 Tax=Aspergillus homomorphus (strain CBS 101889) TaxID=1450537 RepID=A0A395HV68_ASPHC|nr:hypothetical protein BO97DRAFT_406732 [Aspergillus homomorphus CBS 101889]RAL10738.1 hypothetical protein BO97DRAFT_406732 [Aspergillus homomorphus CBS 101889]